MKKNKFNEQDIKYYVRSLHPECVQTNIIFASLYIVAFDMLKDTIINQLKTYYSASIGKNGYKTEVLSLNKKGSPLYGSLVWLKNNDAINKYDLDKFENIKILRNHLAHEMLNFLTMDIDTNISSTFQELLELLEKIDNWWALNVHIECDPDLQKILDKKNDIKSGKLMALQMLYDIALGNEKRAFSYYNAFLSEIENSNSAKNN